MSSRYGFRQSKGSGLWTPYQKPPFGAALIPDHPLNRGLVGCWLFNEGGGNTAFDLSGNGNHGTLTNGPAWVGDPQFRQALSFDGSTSKGYIDCGTGQTLDLTAQFTICGWARYTNVSNPRYQPIFRKGPWRYSLDVQEGKVKVYVNNAASLTGIATIIEGKLYFLLWVHSSIGDYIYVNDVLDNSGDLPDPSSAPSESCVIGGSYSIPPVEWFGLYGSIFFVSIYNRALSGGEIFQLYNEPFCMFQMPSRVKYYYPPANYFALNIKANFTMLQPKIAFDLKNPEVNFSIKKASVDFEIIQ
jgi:hypothetical protein